MGIDDLLSRDGVIHQLKANCKREALRALASKGAALTGISEEEIMATLLEREQLGSTGVGSGVAIPHGKIDSIPQITGVLATLETPVSFDALDDQPVDVIFMLLAPSNATAAHLKALARVSRRLRDEASLASLRGAENPEALFAIAVAEQKDDAA